MLNVMNAFILEVEATLGDLGLDLIEKLNASVSCVVHARDVGLIGNPFQNLEQGKVDDIDGAGVSWIGVGHGRELANCQGKLPNKICVLIDKPGNRRCTLQL